MPGRQNNYGHVTEGIMAYPWHQSVPVYIVHRCRIEKNTPASSQGIQASEITLCLPRYKFCGCVLFLDFVLQVFFALRAQVMHLA